jgi:parallel beta helix pectate lyase-like protein
MSARLQSIDPIPSGARAARDPIPSGARAALLAAILAGAMGLCGPSTACGRTLRVGVDKTYKTVRAAAQAVQSGDTVLVDAGIYSADVTSWNADNLLVRGVGGRAYLRADGAQEGGKGTWVLYGTNFVAENIEFSGASVPDKNGAGIRFDTTGYLVLRNCYFHDNEDGILGGCDSILIENSVFDHNGYGDGQSHNLYVWGRTFTMRFSYTHRAKIGHDVKSRALNNYLLYNRIMDESDGTASYEVDLPDGGRSYLIGNVIEQGPHTDNNAIVSYGEESASNGAMDLYVINNTLVNNDTNGGNFLQLRSGTTAKIVNNIFYGPGTHWSGATVTASNNYFEPSYNNSPRFAAPASYDFHLTSGSPSTIVNAGAAPGSSAAGFPLAPTMQYVYDAQGVTRPAAGALDLGAFEYVPGGAGDVTPPGAVRDLGYR